MILNEIGGALRVVTEHLHVIAPLRRVREIVNDVNPFFLSNERCIDDSIDTTSVPNQG